MRLFMTAAFACAALMSNAQENAYNKAWDALNKSDRPGAETFLSSAVKEKSQFEDAYITGLYLKTFSGKENEINDFEKSFYPASQNPFPYIYALWFNSAITGSYGKKIQDYQVSILDHIISDSKAPGELVAAANYQKGMHYLYSNNFSKAQKAYDEIGSLKNWQYTGPFENLSESGFNKDYGPLKHPEAGATFKSLNNADITWITPGSEIKDGWIPVNYIFQKNTAVVYAQNFINVPSDRTIICNAGATGSVKVWINDRLVISESRERVTEFDAYAVKCDLKKGTNRILVQLGYSGLGYPNFSIRLTDEHHMPLKDITASGTYAAYPQDAGSKPVNISQFAEEYFKSKIAAQPANLVNYLLLADVYMRNKKTEEAKALIDKAVLLAPGNSLLRMKRIEILIKENDRTSMLEEIANIRKEDPESLIIMELDLKEMIDNEKYDDAAVLLQKRIEKYGEDESTYLYKILFLVKEKKYDEVVKLVEKAYDKYPGSNTLMEYMYSIKKDVQNDKKGALRVYEDYRKNIFNYSVEEAYCKVLADGGSVEKALKIRQNLAESFPYDPSMYYKLSDYYLLTKHYSDAESYIKKALAIAPYYGEYWEQLGDIKSQMNDKQEALKAYSKSLEYDPKQFTIIAKIRKLQDKPEVLKLFPANDVEKIIKDDNTDEAKNTDYGFYYILDRKDVVMYPGGATEEYITAVMKITNDKGVERFKESSISYNDNTQSLLIEKEEIIKKNQTKLQGERNGNEIVFTNLQAGDILVFKYRLQNYTYGRFAKDYWDQFMFGGQIYSATTQYNVLMPADKKLSYEFNNSNLKPTVSDAEHFKLYSWESLKPEPLKDEPYMPVLTDAGAVLHISTIGSWNDISGWYSDVINNRAEENSEITNVFSSLFPNGIKSLTEKQRAAIIYNYIEKNIKYSSVSFRQSAYVPQKASTTLITRLGDCKDLSNLFVMLADMAGISSQMVLTSTNNNGTKSMLLPSIEFNHCIVKAVLDKKEYYIELTDNYLPMGSLPNSDVGAMILEIPGKNMPAAASLKMLKPENKTPDAIRRTMDITPNGSDLNVKVTVTRKGSTSSSTRETYSNLDKQKAKQEMEKTIANSYRNNVTLNELNFSDLKTLNDSVEYTFGYKVKNEITEIGTMQTFKIAYPDVVASLDNFSQDERVFPVDYSKYEDQDAYETIVNITAPAGKKFVELPANEKLSFGNMQYSIEYTLKGADKLTVRRRFKSNREMIAATDYPAFKAFFEKIVKAEQKFIAFK